MNDISEELLTRKLPFDTPVESDVILLDRKGPTKPAGQDLGAPLYRSIRGLMPVLSAGRYDRIQR
jgi:hypothetical protein